MMAMIFSEPPSPRSFANEKDAVEVIKWKEIYELLENTLDACEDVANIVEGVVMKNV